MLLPLIALGCSVIHMRALQDSCSGDDFSSGGSRVGRVRLRRSLVVGEA
jgi:hypothetical protein